MNWRVLLFVMSFITAVWAEDNPVTAANKAMKEGRYKEATEHWQEAVKDKKDRLRLPFLEKIAECQQRSNQLEAALKTWQEAISIFDVNLDYHLKVGQIQAWLGHNKEAKKSFEYILTKEANYHDARVGLARVEAWEKNYDAALGILDEVDKRIKNYRDAIMLRAQILGWLDDYESALGIYEKMLEENKQDKEVKLGMLKILMWSRKYEKALQYIDNELKDKPDDQDLLEKKAFVLEALKEDKKALEIYRHLVATYPERADYLARLGMLQSRNAELKNAINNLEKSLSLRKDDLDAYLTLGRVYSWNQRQDEAVALFRKAFEKNPNNMEVRVGLARSLFYVGDWSESRTLLEKTEREFPGNPKVRDLLKRVKDASQPTFVYSHEENYFWNWSDDLKEYVGIFKRRADTLTISQYIGPGTSWELRQRWAEEKSVDHRGEHETDTQLGIRSTSVRLNHSFNDAWRMGARWVYNEYYQRGPAYYRLPESRHRDAGFIYFVHDVEAWRHTLSFGRSIAYSGRSNGRRVSLFHIDDTTWISEWEIDEERKALMYLSYSERPEMRPDRRDTRLQYRWTPKSLKGFEWGTEYRYITHSSAAYGKTWISQTGESFADKLLWEFELESEYEFLGRVWTNEISSTLSYLLRNDLSIDLQHSIYQEEGKDRDYGHDLEVSLNYDF